MTTQSTLLRALGVFASAAIATGCAQTQAPDSDPVANVIQEYETRLLDKDAEISSLQSRLGDTETSLEAARSEMGEGGAVSGDALLPPNAEPGQCYARVLVPPKFRTESERVLKSAASNRVETLPAEFEWVEERVLVREASEKLELVPAVYETVTERVMVKPASTELVAVPAKYRTETERVLVKPERTYWKKGTGPVTKVDEATGEILCLVTDPAVYKDVSKQVLVSDATTQEVAVPAEYATVEKRVMKTPPTTRTVTIPAEYKTVKVRKLARDAQTREIAVPASYETIERRVQVADGYVEWKSVLCQTNMTADVVRRIQSALKQGGHYDGQIDGVIGRRTMAGVESFQIAKSLPRGGLTMETLESLNVNL
ncbi:MAG: hypothetical protein HKO62_04590 [Gammaproteobacteria bacterium]|nr:hypothetical protein [Gammaproteobacteria bacterium]